MLCIAIRLTTGLPFEYLAGVSHNEYFILEHTSLPVSCKRKRNLLFIGSRTSSRVLDSLGLNNFPCDLKFYK